MFPAAYALFGNGSEFRRPGGPMDMQTFTKYAIAGVLVGMLLVVLLKIYIFKHLTGI